MANNNEPYSDPVREVARAYRIQPCNYDVRQQLVLTIHRYPEVARLAIEALVAREDDASRQLACYGLYLYAHRPDRDVDWTAEGFSALLRNPDLAVANAAAEWLTFLFEDGYSVPGVKTTNGLETRER